MYFTRIITITAVASVAVAACGLAASTLSFDYTPSHGAHQQLVRRGATDSISASGSHIQHLDRRSPVKSAKGNNSKPPKKANKKSAPTAAPGDKPAAAPGGKPAAAPGGKPAAAPGGKPAAAPGGKPASPM
ncbi:hypothetical protein IWQ60_009761 [Tieghemiomyces parasiticus]|uniref:Uncharacterized protein n=1 Tax=Tieghemiomyces parasiticus TaxID=78921 RepID=A0A9W7ZWK8_9FUNG|nr:hypothetical protein IWQ60_009761 [Tieghemiomyces parasiticus]